MPRTSRASSSDYRYHVLNRGNARSDVFFDGDDYAGFVDLIGEACEKLPMRVLGYCLMPNHFHLVIHPFEDGDLSRWMQWLLTSHVRRYHRRYQTSGHVWQGRFKGFPVQDDDHLSTLLRFVESNPQRSGLVLSSEDWPWSSLSVLGKRGRPEYFQVEPRPARAQWLRRVNSALSEEDLTALRRCIERGSPFGTASWVEETVKELGLESSIRPRGRPRKSAP